MRSLKFSIPPIGSTSDKSSLIYILVNHRLIHMLYVSLNITIKSPHLNDLAKRVSVSELMIHKIKAEKYYGCIEEVEDNKIKLMKMCLLLQLFII